MPLEDYHRGDICDGPSLSSSSLRALWRASPKEFWDISPLNPLRCDPVDDDSEDLLLGRASHHLICGEANFATRYTVHPRTIFDPGEGKAGKVVPWHGNRTVCKEWLKAKRAAGLSVLKPDHPDLIKGMAIELRKHPFAKSALSGLIERSMFWRDPETGVWLKARPDVIPVASGDYVDLKTTREIDYVSLQQSLYSYLYIMQGALVLQGALELKLEVNSFSLMFVQKRRPFCTFFLPVDDYDVALGGQMNRLMLLRFQRCYQSRTWPGPAEGREGADVLRLSEKHRDLIKTKIERITKEAA